MKYIKETLKLIKKLTNKEGTIVYWMCLKNDLWSPCSCWIFMGDSDEKILKQLKEISKKEGFMFFILEDDKRFNEYRKDNQEEIKLVFAGFIEGLNKMSKQIESRITKENKNVRII